MTSIKKSLYKEAIISNELIETLNGLKQPNFDALIDLWKKRRAALAHNKEALDYFLEQKYRAHTIETGAVEGIYTTTRGLTSSIIKYGISKVEITPEDTNIEPKKLRNILQDQEDGIQLILDIIAQNRPLSESTIRQLHAILLRSQDSYLVYDQFDNAHNQKLTLGAYKEHPNFPTREGITYLYCEPALVPSAMLSLLETYSKLKESKIPSYILAAWLHYQFIIIHPFADGNGRIARLLASLVLMESDLFPFTVERGRRTEYFEALEKSDNGDFGAFVQYLVNQQQVEIEEALKISSNISAELNPAFNNLTKLSDLLKQKTQNLAQSNTQKLEDSMADYAVEIGNIIIELHHKLEVELSENQNIQLEFERSETGKEFWYKRNIIGYARENNYYANLNLNKYWWVIKIEVLKQRFKILFTFHHRGYVDSETCVAVLLLNNSTDTNTKINDLNSGIDYYDNYINLNLRPVIINIDQPVTTFTKAKLVQELEIAVERSILFIIDSMT